MLIKIIKTTVIFVLIVVIYLFNNDPFVAMGEFKWVYLGNNISVIKHNGENIIGPGNIELNISSNIIHGIVTEKESLISKWFVICMDTNKVYIDEYADKIEMMVVRGQGNNRNFRFGNTYKTFQSYKSSLKYR